MRQGAAFYKEIKDGRCLRDGRVSRRAQIYVLTTVTHERAPLFSRHANRAGPVWQRNHYERAVGNNEDLTTIARYVVATPLRSGVVKKPGDYPHWDAAWM